MNLLYIITNGDLGGAQIHLLQLIRNLPANYHVAVIIGDTGWLYQELQKQGIKVYYVRTLVREISPVKDTLALLTLRRIIDEVKPDIVHCHSSKAGFLGRIAAKVCHIPAVFTAHGWAFTEGVNSSKRLIYKILENMAAKWTEKIICVSEYDRQLGLKAISNGDRKLVTIHNGIVYLPKWGIEQDRITSGRVRLIMVARFSSPKDQTLLLKALSILKTEGFRFETTLVGDGPSLEPTKMLASELGVKEDVYFAGARSDVDDLLVKQDIFVLTSNWEGFPISILEAMRQGLPVISSDVGGVNEAVIDGETGFLIPRGDVEYLVKRLRELSNNPELCKAMGCKGREKFEEFFAVEKMLEKTVHVYQEVPR